MLAYPSHLVYFAHELRKRLLQELGCPGAEPRQHFKNTLTNTPQAEDRYLQHFLENKIRNMGEKYTVCVYLCLIGVS